MKTPTPHYQMTEAISRPALAPSWKPETIMLRPDKLAHLTDAYFEARKQYPRDHPDNPIHQDPRYVPPAPPTPASFALYVGFASVPQMLKAIENDNHPYESRHVLLAGCTQIEATLSEAALTDRVNSSFTKFMLSARLGVIEKKEEIKSDNRVNINILGVSVNDSPLTHPRVPVATQTPQITLEDLL